MASIQYTSRLVSTAADGVLVETKYIKDEAQGKLQSDINAELYKQLSEIDRDINSAVYRIKGSVDSFQDLPGDPNPGDVYNVKTKVTLGDQSYPANTNFVWTVDDGWDSLGGILDNTELKEYKTETAGKLKEITSRLDTLEGDGEGSIKEEIKSYTDQKFKDTLTWIEDEDLFPGTTN